MKKILIHLHFSQAIQHINVLKIFHILRFTMTWEMYVEYPRRKIPCTNVRMDAHFWLKVLGVRTSQVANLVVYLEVIFHSPRKIHSKCPKNLHLQVDSLKKINVSYPREVSFHSSRSSWKQLFSARRCLAGHYYWWRGCKDCYISGHGTNVFCHWQEN